MPLGRTQRSFPQAQGAGSAPVTPAPPSSGVGPASCSCLQSVFAGTRLHPARGLPPMCVLPRVWRSTRLPDMLCKIRLSWRVHLIISHFQIATSLTDHGLFPSWESPALCSGQTLHLFTCSILNHLLSQILSFLVWWRSRPSLPEGWRSPKIVIASLSSHGKQRAEAQTALLSVTLTSNLVFLLYWFYLPERTYSFKCKNQC